MLFFRISPSFRFLGSLYLFAYTLSFQSGVTDLLDALGVGYRSYETLDSMGL